jgi:hypothetical protein
MNEQQIVARFPRLYQKKPANAGARFGPGAKRKKEIER